MTRLKSRSAFPPGGWAYRQPETNWVNPAPLNHTFDKTVKLIQAHRLNNPRFPFPTSYESVANDLDNYTCMRLKSDPQWVETEGNEPVGLTTSPKRKKVGCQTCR